MTSEVDPSLLLLQGVARFYQAKKRHVITTQTEHKCVLDSCRILEAEGLDVTYLPVQNNGLLDLEVQYTLWTCTQMAQEKAEAHEDLMSY